MLYEGFKVNSVKEAYAVMRQEAAIGARDEDDADFEFNLLRGKFDDSREEGSVLLTKNGFIEGHFVGTVEYAVGGDAETGWETDRCLAFRKKDGRVVMAIPENPIGWWLVSVHKGVKIHWGEYPENFDASKTAPDNLLPKPKKKPRLSDFVDSPGKKNAGKFLYIVSEKVGSGYLRSYEGHNRKVAAKYMKKIKNSGKKPNVEVVDVTETNMGLPF